MGLYKVTIAGLYEWNENLFDKKEYIREKSNFDYKKQGKKS